MGRTTGARIGVAVALLLAVPAWASTIVELTGTIATHDAAAGGALSSVSALKSVKNSLQNTIPKFEPPKIDEVDTGASKAPAGSSRAPASHGSVGGGAWKAAGASTGSPTTLKSGWTTPGTGHSAGAKTSQAWASAAASGGHTSGASGWKTAGSTSTTSARH